MKKTFLIILTICCLAYTFTAKALGPDYIYPENQITISSGTTIENQTYVDTYLIVDIKDNTTLNLNNIHFSNSFISIRSGLVNINDSVLNDSTLSADKSWPVETLRLNINETTFDGGYFPPNNAMLTENIFCTAGLVTIRGLISVNKSLFKNFRAKEVGCTSGVSLGILDALAETGDSLEISNNTFINMDSLCSIGSGDDVHIKVINNTIFSDYNNIGLRPGNTFANNIFSHSQNSGYPDGNNTIDQNNNLHISGNVGFDGHFFPNDMYPVYDTDHNGEIHIDAYQPSPNSPSIDSGDNAFCPPQDQLGQARNDGACDIGSIEYQHPVTSPDVVLDIRQNQCPNRTRISVNNPNASLDFVIAGNNDFDTNDILSYELELEGEPINMRRLIRNVDRINNERLNYEPSPTLCLPKTQDGIKDMMIHIYHSDVIDAVRRKLGRDPAHNEVVELTISGELKDGTEFEASDFLQIRH